MKLKKEFIYHEYNGNVMLVASGNAEFSGLVKGNRMFGEILALMKNDTTEEAISAALRDKYNAEDGVIEQNVRSIVEKLRGIGAVED